MNRSRLIVGLALILVAALLLVLGDGSYATSGVVFFLILGIISIATSRNRRGAPPAP